MLGMMAFTRSPVEDERLEGFEALQFAMSPEPLVWGVADGHVVVGTTPEAVALCLETARGKHPGILKNARVMREAILPEGPFSSVSLADQRGAGEQLAGVMTGISMASGMATMAIPDPQVRTLITKLAGILGKLAPVARRIDFYKSTASLTTYENNAWRTRAVTHYAGAGRASKTRHSRQRGAVVGGESAGSD